MIFSYLFSRYVFSARNLHIILAIGILLICLYGTLFSSLSIQNMIQSNTSNNETLKNNFSHQNILTDMQKNVRTQRGWGSIDDNSILSTSKGRTHNYVQLNTTEYSKTLSKQTNKIVSHVKGGLSHVDHVHQALNFSQRRLKILNDSIQQLTNLNHLPLYEAYKMMDYKTNLCQQYQIEGNLDRIVIPHIWQEINPPQNYTDVTLVTQISLERLGILERLLINWEGPISVALYLSRLYLNNTLSLIEPYLRIMRRDNLDIHLVLQNGVRNVDLYQILALL